MSDLKHFKFWCHKVLPLVYDNSLSYMETLCKVVEYLNNLIDDNKAIIEKVDGVYSDIEKLKDEMLLVQGEIDKIKNGEYVSVYIDALSKWIDDNLQEMVAKFVTFVTFGLSADGYFVAYIPSTWDFLQFDTIVTPNDPLYGHLILTY